MLIRDCSSDVCSSALGRLTAGTLDGQLAVRTPVNHPLRVNGTLALADGALETPDGSIAAEQLGGRFRIDYRRPAGTTLLALDGELRGGQFLYGTTYVVLPETPVPFALDALGDGVQGWSLSSVQWSDGEALVAQGSAGFGPDASLRDLDIDLRSRDLSGLPARYLFGRRDIGGLPARSSPGDRTRIAE